MSTSVNTLNGDTFEALARRHLGETAAAGRVAAANPGLREPFSAGVTVLIPRTENPASTSLADSSDPDLVTLVIAGSEYKFFTNVELTLTIDSIDVMSFSSNSTEVTRAILPLTYTPAQVYIGGALVFNGVLLAPRPTLTSTGAVVTFVFYSRIGVLGDCTPPVGLFGSLESSGQDLAGISSGLTAPFGIATVFLAPAGSPFDKVAIKRTEKILPYLVGLAQQKSLILTNDERGDLVYFRSTDVGSPVADIPDTLPPGLRGTVSINPLEYYSHVTGVAPTTVGAQGATHTEVTRTLTNVLRPYTRDLKDVAPADLPASVQALHGRMSANAIEYNIPVSTWRTPAGQLWQPNTTVLFQSADLYCPNPYEFLIKSVTLTDDGTAKTGALTLVLPGVYSGQPPELLPWQ